MSVRSVDFLDLPSLLRFRQAILPLDSARLLTRGNPLGTTALLSYLNPRRNLHTALASENGASLMGQIILNEGETSARLTFLAPADKVNGLTLPLLDHLTSQAGEWGALYVLAELDEDSLAFKRLRQAGFAMYAWQRVWKLPLFTGQSGKNPWRRAEEQDWLAVQFLHAQIVPALLQPLENLPKQASGLVCFAEDGLQACAMFSSGPKGIWLLPLVLPDSNCFPAQIHTLVRAVGNWNNRAVYMCVRSYQAWLEATLEELGAEAGPRQAVMVKRLAQPVKELQSVPVMEKALAKVKPAAPLARTDNDR
jgi:hypothetical protein